MLISKHARQTLAYATFIVAAFLLVGCGGAPTVGWSSANADKDMVYFGTVSGKVFAVATKDGSLKWEFPSEQGKNLGAVYGTPALMDGKLYIGAHDKKFYVLDAVTGKSICDFTAGESIVSSAVVSGGVVYFGANDSKVYALDAANCGKKWEFKAGNQIWADPTFADGVLYAASLDHKLYALDASSGAKKWDFDGSGIIVTKPAVAGGVIYFAALQKFYALDAQTGQSKWDKPFEADGWVWSNPTVVEGTIYFGSLGNQVYALDAQSGKVKWNVNVPAENNNNGVRSAIFVNGDTAYFGAQNFKVYAIETATGKTKWAFATKDRVIASPVVTDGVVFIPSFDRMFYALTAQDGKPRWVMDTSTGKLASAQ